MFLAQLFASGGVSADQQWVSGAQRMAVVELYTSEGCNACPPADRFLSQLGATREADGIIPLAFHVDYWDDLGWKDPFASAAFTSRQRQVARSNRQSVIYTPEFVVDGRETRGSRAITDRVQAILGSPAEADLVMTLSQGQAGRINVQVMVSKLQSEDSDPADLLLAVYEKGLSSQVSAGENAGKTLAHDYVVRYLSPPQSSQEGAQHHFELQLEPGWKRDALGLVAWVQSRASGRVLQGIRASL